MKVNYPKGMFGAGYEEISFPVPFVCHECGRQIADTDYSLIVSKELGEDQSIYKYAYPLHVGRCYNKMLRRIRANRAGYASDSY